MGVLVEAAREAQQKITDEINNVGADLTDQTRQELRSAAADLVDAAERAEAS